MSPALVDPWMVAAWPGMGGVAQIAARQLVRALDAEVIDEIPGRDYFDISTVGVEKGLVGPALLPCSLIYGWHNPAAGGRDLVIFLGEEQPTGRCYAFCGKLLDVAEQLGVRRVFTFAAMATPSHPADDPRVLAVATRHKLLEGLLAYGAHTLEQGEIGGLNGVLLAAAASREMDGVGLLGEFPFFASRVPNPNASRAVLHVFAALAGLQLDLAALDEQVELVRQQLVELYDAMAAAGHLIAPPRKESEIEESAADEDVPAGRGAAQPPPIASVLDPETEQHIESLFEEARRDRSRALALKSELDRHGVFKRYEDRFLDLFRKAG